MAKGFIRGALWGAGVGLGAITVISVVDVLRERSGASSSRAALDAAREVPGANRTPGREGPSAIGLSNDEVPAPEPDTLATLVAEALEPAAVPRTGGAPTIGAAATPADDALSGVASPTDAAPSLPAAGAIGLDTPATEPRVSVSTDPAQPPLPEPVPQATAFADVPEEEVAVDLPEAPDAQARAEMSDVPEAEVDVPPDVLDALGADLTTPEMPDTALRGAVREGAPPERPRQQNFAAMPDTVSEPQAQTGRVYPAQSGPQPEQAPVQPAPVSVQAGRIIVPSGVATPAFPAPIDIAERPSPGATDAPVTEDTSSAAQVDVAVSIAPPETDAPIARATVPQSMSISEAPDITRQAALPEVSRSEVVLAPDALTPAAPNAESTPAQAEVQAQTLQRPSAPVRVNRLPSLGVEAPSPEPEVPEENPEVTAPAPVDTATPFERYAAPFEVPEGKPLMAVILLDEGANLTDPTTGLAAIEDLPYPVSIAVDPLRADAAERMSAFRAAGFEVLAAIDLPSGATATDAEVNLSAALDTMPEVIGVLEGIGSGIQSSPSAGRQVADILAQTGHAFVSQNRGLNTAQKLAARQGVPSEIVFRDFDADTPDASVIRRFMDQAAFRASRDGDAVMLGRLRPQTLAALLSWSLQDRASTVAMAPVSAVLSEQPGS